MRKNNQSKSEGEQTEKTFRSIMRTSRMIWQVMEPFFESHGISLSQWVVLRHLLIAEESGQSAMPLAELNKRLMVRQPTLTAVVNKLEQHGLVRRLTPVTDRRERTLGLTAKGRDLLASVLIEHYQRIESLLSVWTAEEKAVVLNLFERLGASLETHEQFSYETRIPRGNKHKKNG